jgi:hypothetical protein
MKSGNIVIPLENVFAVMSTKFGASHRGPPNPWCQGRQHISAGAEQSRAMRLCFRQTDDAVSRELTRKTGTYLSICGIRSAVLRVRQISRVEICRHNVT